MAQNANARAAVPGAAVSLGKATAATGSLKAAEFQPVFPTRLPAELTGQYGLAELHAVMFQPRGDAGGSLPAVSIQVPECSRQQFRRGLALARELSARVQVLCDTAEQAARVRRVASRHLPDHGPVALDRALAGAWGLAS